jgi:predicted GNAT family acetyltransferase
MNPLDRPIWSALSGRQSHLARGNGPALAFKTDVEPFAAAETDTAEAMEALAALAVAGDDLVLIQSTPSPIPTGLHQVAQMTGVQMVANSMAEPRPLESAEPLTDDDIPQMMELAELTKPGPFRAQTNKLGQFWGIKRDGRLVAMAGERLKVPGMSEVSGVCTHPDWQGYGFAAGLSTFVAGRIQARGEVPFLHAFEDNLAAIQLYEKLGFTLRSRMAVQVLALPESR